jgi:hypothetical protein
MDKNIYIWNLTSPQNLISRFMVNDMVYENGPFLYTTQKYFLK